MKSENGIALIIVISIMAVLASIAAAFSYSMIMDQRAAANYMNGIKADYVAKAGIQHAIGVLKKDGDPSNGAGYCPYEGYDWYGDDWGYDSTLFGINNTVGPDTCISNDDNIASSYQPTGAPNNSDSHWINLTDSQGRLIGRYAVLVIDESGKVNINTAGVDSYGLHGWTTKEIRLDPDGGGILFSTTKANKILDARYGDNRLPGADSVDDNADSVVLNNDGIDNDGVSGADNANEGTDDPAEFYIARPYTNSSEISADTPFVTVGEIVSLAGLSDDDYNDSSCYITAFSSDKNLTDSGLARLNINAVSSAMELYSTLRDAFDYWDTSATDSELAQMAVNIIDFRDRDNGSTRIDIEGPDGTVITRYGVEGIRINEVMVRPVFRKLTASSGDGSTSGTDWVWDINHWKDDSDAGNTDVWVWADGFIPDGTYKLSVYGAGGVDIKAKTSVNGGTTWLKGNDDADDGTWYNNTSDYVNCDTVIINGSGVQIKIKNANNTDTAYFDSAVFSQSPDCEYVELVNISPNSVDVGGWHLEFPNGQVGTIPGGTSIAATGDSGDTIVLAIDMADSDVNNGTEVYNNEIYFTKAYPGLSNVYQLDFTNDVQDDILADTVLMDSPLRLYDDSITPTIDPTTKVATPAGHIVDQVLWDSVVIQDNDFYSMERDDPTYLGTEVLNDSGIFDSWLISTSIGGSPTEANKNATSANIKVKNSPFANIGEVADVPYSKTKWTNIGSDEDRIKSIADRITVSGRRLDAEFADYAATNWTLATLQYDNDEIKRKYGRNLKDSDDKLYWFKAEPLANSNEDTWTWYTTIDRFEADTYIMYVYGREGGTMRVRVDNDTAMITPSTDYGARFGQVVVSDTTLSVAIKADASSADSVYFDYVLLTPASKTYGRLNINTATASVLQGLKGVGSTSPNIVGHRDALTPKAFKSIGELLDVTDIGIATFKPISNLITTKSNVFKIICTGQSILDKNGNGTFDTEDEVLGERKITVIYER